MVDRGGTTQRLSRTVASALFVLTVNGCAAGSPSASPLAGSGSQVPTDSASFASPSLAPTPIPTPYLPTSSSNLFTLLPASQPADFVSEITCTGSIGASDAVAIVSLQSAIEGQAGEVVLRDYADASNPRTACTFGSNGPAQLIDSRHVVIGANGAMAVVDLPEVQYHWFQLVSYQRVFLAVGPELDQVLWMREDPDAGMDMIYLSTSAGDQIVATLPSPGRGRCGSPEFDSKVAAYTHSGSHLFVLNEPYAELNSLVVIAGATNVLSVIPPSGGWVAEAWPMMALWSPTTETLYYRRSGDVWKWTEGSDPQLFLPEVSWINPSISADGAHLAYSGVRPDGLHEVYLVDLANGGSPQKIGDGARKSPVFVNSTQLWFRSEGEDHGCGGAEGEKPLIYDIVDKAEFPSIIEWVRTVWPATSSNW